MFTIERQFHMKESPMPIAASMTQMPGDTGVTSSKPDDTEAQQLIRAFLPDSIPSDVRNKPFYEIARYKDENGNNIGVSAIGDAWTNARQYLASRAPANDAKISKLMVDLASLSSGAGTSDNQIQNFMIGFDKYGKSMVMPNIELSGLTFFTRPRLCLQSSNLRSNPNMVPLDTTNPNSIAFAIRFLLDTNLANTTSRNAGRIAEAIKNSPLVNPECPWFIPLTNALTSFSGLPSFELGVESTDGGYFSEAQKYATGSDNFSSGGYSINCEFRDLPGSIMLAIFYYWLEYIRCVVRGDMLAYPDDIDGQIMNYTVSIYSFNMDPSMHYITSWVKCTGCFPTSLNIGDRFSKNANDPVVKASQNLTVNFACNRIEYMKPECLLDFNTLAVRYCPTINLRTNATSLSTDNSDSRPLKDLARPAIPDSAFANFCGLPFITSDPNGYKLIYRASERDLFANPVIRELIAYDIAHTEKEWSVEGRESNYSLYQKYDYNDFYMNNVQKNKSNYTGDFSFDKLVNNILDYTNLELQEQK